MPVPGAAPAAVDQNERRHAKSLARVRQAGDPSPSRSLPQASRRFLSRVDALICRVERVAARLALTVVIGADNHGEDQLAARADAMSSAGRVNDRLTGCRTS
ncbi:hypothetical protein Acy02nite_57310 [Actinoplanes cyaneus]|uniref:Uncharacterized protein n=1 Tax=Actinoplanes cyaneus TaxID=52696 RepID=A0A919M323_9ACTN|nr:hypothetical protein Acy02nite_57310 [Actinoplanes cyaneus]